MKRRDESIMKVEVKKIDAVKRKLKFEVPKEKVAQTFDEVYQEFGKVAKIKGFRPGKVPRHILEAEHGKTAENEVIKKLIPQIYQEGIVKENLTPIDMPEINDVALKNGILNFTALLEIRPEVMVRDYKGIKITRKTSEVLDEEMNKTLEYFQKGQGQERQVIVDDAFARGLGYPSLEDFKRQLESDKDRQNRADIENQIIENLLSKAKMSVPLSLVKKQIERRIQQAHQRLHEQGVSEEEIKKREEAMRQELQEPVEKDIKVYFILDKIAELEKIEVKEQGSLPSKVMEFLLKEAQWV